MEPFYDSGLRVPKRLLPPPLRRASALGWKPMLAAVTLFCGFDSSEPSELVVSISRQNLDDDSHSLSQFGEFRRELPPCRIVAVAPERLQVRIFSDVS